MLPTIAVTGASGHLGNTICRLLCNLGYSVRALYHNDDRALAIGGIQKIRGDVLSRPDLEQLLEGCECVIHCAAIISIHGDPDGRVFTTNTVGCRNLLEVASALGIRRIVHVSSTHAVHELPHDTVYDETRPYKKKGDYAYDFSKATGEQIMLQTQAAGKPEIVVVRPSSVIGPFDFKPSPLGTALLDFYHRKIPLLPPGGYNFVDVRDAAESIVNALTLGADGEVYLLSGHYHSMQNFAAIVEKLTGIQTPKRSMPYWLMKAMLPAVAAWAMVRRAAPVFSIEAIDALVNGHPNMDNSKAAKALGHRVRPLEESIRDFYTWQNLPANK